MLITMFGNWISFSAHELGSSTTILSICVDVSPLSFNMNNAVVMMAEVGRVLRSIRPTSEKVVKLGRFSWPMLVHKPRARAYI